MLWFLLSCSAPEPDKAPPSTLGHTTPIVCEGEGVYGFDRFSEEGQSRGLTHVIPDLRELLDNPDRRLGAGVAAGDIDGDGDIDLIAGTFLNNILVYMNDGSGHFTTGPPPPELTGTALDIQFGIQALTMNIALVDLDADRLPELLSTGFGFFAVYPNLGGEFGEPALVVNEQGLLGFHLGLAIGDMDGDDDLDVVVISNSASEIDCAPDTECEFTSWPDTILENQGGLEFVLAGAFYAEPGVGSHAQLGVFTDRDNDADLDLIIPKDWLGENAFFRNKDGDWVDDDKEIGADIQWSAMGLDSLDLNNDGWLDYCVTDTGPIRCLLSVGTDRYVQGSAALGLFPDGIDSKSTGFNQTVGWSVLFNDLDNDGYWDMASPSAPMGNQESVQIEEVSDLMFAGQPDGTFVDVSREAGFDDISDNYGMVQADFDRDGFLEIVLTGPGNALRFYDNACNDNNWITMEFEGPGLNRDGWNATVVVEAGDRRWMRELLPLPGPGHSPPQVHIGLGEFEVVDSIEVRWPGGARASAQDIPARQRVTLTAQ